MAVTTIVETVTVIVVVPLARTQVAGIVETTEVV